MRKLIFTLLFICTSFLLKAQTTVFSETFDTPPPNMSSSGSPGWFINSRLQTSIPNSDSSYISAPGDISYLESPSFDCSFNFFVTLKFKQICKIEFFDRGTIELSTDGGVTWTQLIDDGTPATNCTYLGAGFFGTQQNSFREASYPNWLPGQTVLADNSWWQNEEFDISGLAGNNGDVRIRFKVADDNNNGGAGRNGWFVDDVEVIASFCELIPPAVYNLPPVYPGTVYNTGPYTINIAATDISGIASASLNYTINSVAQPTILMANIADSTFQGIIPAAVAGDTICYYVEIADASFCGNLNYIPGPTSVETFCFIVEDGISYPYCDNFDITTNLWTPSAVNTTSVWELGTPAFGATNSAHTAPNSWDINLTSAYANSANASLVSPQLSFITGAGATFEFWHNWSTEGGWDGVRVEWTTDTTTGPWNVLGSVGCVDCINWYTDATLATDQLPGWEGNSQGWIKSSIILDTQFNNLPQVWFRFRFVSDGSVNGDGYSIDDVCISLPQPDDVGVTAITQPGPTGPAGNCLDVLVDVKNYGLNTQTSFPVTYVVQPGGLTGTATYTGSLTPGATAQVTIPCFVVPVGPYSICAYTGLPGDANNFNDTTCSNSIGIPVLTLTSCDDFESGNNGFQTFTTNANNADWQLGTPAFGVTTGAFSGVNAWDINLISGYGVGAEATLTTPIYDLANPSVAINPYLSFRRNMNTAASDGLRVFYDANGSGTWTLLGTVGDVDGYNWYNAQAINGGDPGWSGNSNGWQESRYYLQNIITASSATFIQFRFEFTSGFNGTPNDGVSIDDLCIKQPGPDDVGVTTIVEPNPNGPAGGTSNAIVVIRNFGTATQNSIPVEYTVNPGGITGTATYIGALAPNATALLNMPTFTVPSGTYTFSAYTQLPGDSDNSNDTTTVNRVGVPVIPLTYTSPFCDNYDGTNVGWSANIVGTGNPGTQWELGAPTFGATNTAFTAPNAWDINLNVGYTGNANCELLSPIFDLSNAVDVKLSFWRNSNCEDNWDGVRLEYSISGGPWTLLGGAAAPAPCWVNWYNFANLLSSGLPGWAGTTGGWVKVEANCLNIFDNEPEVQFRFVFTSDGAVQEDGFSIDDFCVTVPVPLTAAPITVNTSAINNSFIFPGQSIQFTSPISNPGTTPLTSVDATLTINGVPIVTDPIAYSPALASQANLPHTFSQLWTAAPGVYDVCVITSNPNGGTDLNPFDDTTCITISVFDSVTVTSGNPYCTDFETGPQWVSVNALTYNNTSGNSWELGTPNQTIINSAFSGVNAWTIDLDANYQGRDTSGLFSPVFSIDNTSCYKLSFQHKYDTEPFMDGGTVEYSTDFAVTWNQLGFASSTPQPWYNTSFITALGGIPGLPGWSGTETSWVLAEKETSFPSGSTVIFRFRFASDNTTNNYEGWAIDDVCFEMLPVPCVVGINDPQNGNGMILGQNYPNPFNTTSVIGYSIPSEGDVRISITNVLGQEIAVPVEGARAAGNHTFTIDSKDFGAGIYYYTLEFDGQKMTNKMVITE
ncbi:MAG: T9SS type A sorting domain-containing protein [Bacteroidetes bacterium]|nr:T9SS type A sorting domain-containing protein [Bacteroidota bacterium]